MELTTASELDVRPFEDEEQDEDVNSQADNEDEVLQGPGIPPRRKASKRELARRAEVIRTDTFNSTLLLTSDDATCSRYRGSLKTYQLRVVLLAKIPRYYLRT